MSATARGAAVRTLLGTSPPGAAPDGNGNGAAFHGLWPARRRSVGEADGSAGQIRTQIWLALPSSMDTLPKVPTCAYAA
jgi:hypothetical protein